MHFDSRGGLRIDTFLTRGPFFFFLFLLASHALTRGCATGVHPSFLEEIVDASMDLDGGERLKEEDDAGIFLSRGETNARPR